MFEKDKYNLDKEFTDEQLSKLIIKNEFKEFYISSAKHTQDLLEKEQILKKYKKADNLLEFDDT